MSISTIDANECAVQQALVELTRGVLRELAYHIMYYRQYVESSDEDSVVITPRDYASTVRLSVKLALLLSFIAVSSDAFARELARKLLKLAIYAGAMMSSDAVREDDVLIIINDVIKELDTVSACE